MTLTFHRSLWDYLRQVRKENGTTVFLTTHYLEEAEQADNICMMNKGKIVACDTPERLIATLVLPVLLIGLFGEGLQATPGSSLGYNYLTFVANAINNVYDLSGKASREERETCGKQKLKLRATTTLA